MPRRRPLTERFWEKVEKGPGCWLWTGATNRGGYGKIGSGEGGKAERTLLAPHVAWELANGPIPRGLWVLHYCDNPPCVRPDHLFLGTHQDNMNDMRSKGRSPRPDRRGERNPRYGVSLSAETRLRIAAAEAKTVWVLDPNGAVLEITNLTRFCREHGLNQGGMWQIATGRKQSYKDYRALEHNYRVALAAGKKDVSDG